jgi:membrane protein
VAREGESSRGRRAETPSQIPKAGWRDILLRVKNKASADQLSIISAGVAFYTLMSIFPALVAAVSIYGLVADPAGIERQLQQVQGVLPADAYSLLESQLQEIVTASGGALGLGLVVGVLVALWSASAAVKTLMTALNVAYDEEERRGFVKFTAVALLLTLGAILFGIVALSVVVALPAIIGFLGLGRFGELAVTILRWPLLAFLVIVALAVVYRFGPSRENPQWQWVSWGAVAATVAWLVASMLFSFYVSNFADYNETYGSLGAVVILMLWLLIGAYVVLLGAELNSEMEHQTARDTTTGEPRPMGQRDAHVANTVGRRP